MSCALHGVRPFRRRPARSGDFLQWNKYRASVRPRTALVLSLSLITQRYVSYHSKNMTAVEDMLSYKAMADAHAEGVRKLNPPFKALYDSMSDVQKRNADSVFRTNPHHI